MTRRRRRLLALSALLALAVVAYWRLPFWSARLIASKLSVFFKRPVSVAEVRFGLFPFEVEILDLRVGGVTPEAQPFMEIPRLTAAPSLSTLFGGSRIVLTRLRLQGLTIRIHAPPEGGDDIPRPGGGGAGGPSIRIRRFVIEKGEFYLDHRRVPLDLDLPELEGRLTGRRAGMLGGRIAFGPGPLRFGSAPALDVRTEIDVLMDGPLVTVESGRLQTERIDLAYTGQIRIARDPVGQFALKGPVDLGVIDRHVARTGFGMQGAAQWDGILTVTGPRLRLKGRMEGTAGVWDQVPVPRFATDFGWDEKGVHLRGLEVETLGGRGTLNVEIPPGKSIAHLDARMQDADAEGLWMAIFDVGSARLGAAATGEVSIDWPKGRIRELSGRIALDLAPRPDGRTPLTGRFEWHAKSGVQFVDKADLVTPATRTRLEGRIEVDDRTHLNVDGESLDLAATDDLGTRIRRALGNPDAQAAGFRGSGVFRGLWRGTLQVPVFEGRFSGGEVAFLDVVWGRAEWAGVADPYKIASHSLVVRRAGGELWLDGVSETGYYGEQDGVDVRVRIRSWPAVDFVKAFKWDLDLSGLVSGAAAVGGRRSAPAGWARLTAQDGRYYGVPFQDLEVAARMRGVVSDVTSGHARVGGGDVRFKGTMTLDGVYDGEAELDEVDIGDLVPPPAPHVRWGGRVSGRATLQGTLEKPRVQARLSSRRLFLGDEGLGALEATLRGDGAGSVTVGARCRSPRVDLALEGSVGADVPYPASLRLVAHETSFDPFLRAVAPSLPGVVGIVATGEMELRGPLAAPRELRVDTAVASLRVLLPEFLLENRDPLRLAIDGGRLQVRDLHLAGEGTDLGLEGSLPVLGDGPVELAVRGEADLRTLSLVTRQLRGRGSARLVVAVVGTRGAPRVDGTLDLDRAGLRVRGFPHGLEDVQGSVHFSEDAAHFEGVTGSFGGGSLELEGQAAYSTGRLTSFDVHGTGRGLSLRYPEGLRSAIDADLRFYGDTARQWVTGDVEVRQALYTRRYDVASELLATRPVAEETGALGENLRYDVRLRAPGTFRIDNNLATLQARADLVLQGSYASPVVLGRAEIDRGRVYFQGNTYVIRRGTLDFANPHKVDPFFDIEAETRIRSYRVTLKMNGTLERVEPTLTSDPPLSAVQILSLLAGADESAVASLSQAQADQARLAATGAATLAAGKISEEVGLERGAERLFGLNRFSIDPSLVKGSGVINPTARLTVGKRITSDLNVLYSVDLRGTEERILSVEYTLSDRFSLLMTRSEPGGFGFDLRLRRSY